ncbi:MAG TPA: FAD:protein FMN transferase [Pseudolysinimonas sp.]|jgi:thiamine biosynthesis lipoprotein
MRHVFATMGTVVSLDLAEPPVGLLPRIEGIFAEADARFSLHRPDSELSRINAGDVSLLDASPELAEAYALAAEWRSRTDGCFTPSRPDGLLDLNGVVKAIAMRDAGAVLESSGFEDWTLVVGGDVFASGAGQGRAPWSTGIVDPADRTALLCAIELRDPRRAIATSGSAERGDHIWSSTGPSEFLQVTVVADDILTADVLATAIVAGGDRMLRAACEGWSVDVLAVEHAGGLSVTPGFRSALAAAS